jgi:hypothetical protein
MWGNPLQAPICAVLPHVTNHPGGKIELHLSATATMNWRLKCLGKIQRAGLGNFKRAPTTFKKGYFSLLGLN